MVTNASGRLSSEKTYPVNESYLITSMFVGLCLSSEKENKKPLSDKCSIIRVLIINIKAH